MKGSINEKFLSLFEFHVWIEHVILRNLDVLFNVQLPLVFMLIVKIVRMIWVGGILLNLHDIFNAF